MTWRRLEKQWSFSRKQWDLLAIMESRPWRRQGFAIPRHIDLAKHADGGSSSIAVTAAIASGTGHARINNATVGTVVPDQYLLILGKSTRHLAMQPTRTFGL